MNRPDDILDVFADKLLIPTSAIAKRLRDIEKAWKELQAAARKCPCAGIDGALCKASNRKNESTEDKIVRLSRVVGVNPAWALAIAQVESSMGKFQKSPTGARGIFQLTTIAMKDVWLQMELHDDDIADILCGLLFLKILLKRWKSEREATMHYCDPNDRRFYVPKVMNLIEEYGKEAKS